MAASPGRPFCCPDCGRRYRHRGSLANHQHTHRPGLFSCPSCPKTFPNLMALRNHARLHRRRPPPRR
ncbi:ZN646 protein, partial [Penelope pileata]|nr:ZN646 protein [Penelope pileata]